ncbi:MAG TPA: hypothetical protein VK427_16570, partial [Kofleriaceae bacterium]|nr:hypothetical protein [Kofleriaceae bacterium]
KLVLRLQTATPVCCDEPGCYVRFPGQGRAAVPAAIACALDCAERPVVIVVALVHEPGYQHIDHARGTPLRAGPDTELVYDEW